MAARILIVEDEESLTTLLRYNLEAAGYAVETVTRGDEAELRLSEEPPDLVLLDWMLPGVSGVELCRRIRTRKSTEHHAHGAGAKRRTGCAASPPGPTITS